MPKDIVDIKGQVINLADTVKIIEISNWLSNNLDEDALGVLKACKNKPLAVIDIDEYGFVWLEVVVTKTKTSYESHLFGLEPNTIEKI